MKFLPQRQIVVVRQGPGLQNCCKSTMSYQVDMANYAMESMIRLHTYILLVYGMLTINSLIHFSEYSVRPVIDIWT